MRKIITPDSPPVREAVGIFNDIPSLYDCVEELQTHGFDRSDITLLAHPHLETGGNDDKILDTHKLEDDPLAKRVAFIEPESIGDAEGALIGLPLYVLTLIGAGVATAFGATTVMTIAVAAALGAIGACLGAGAAYWLKKKPEAYYRAQLTHGGIPLWVHVKDKKHEKQALEVLNTNHAEDVHIHDLPETAYETREGRTTVLHLIH
ncbi:hypothetical protein A9Q83_08520 [Alphaproteobacteria bacterium 46_93_T64]|nr:hypothetical protein A9Q83_08520 [Alphaproteobacteria bacterium 46_93_T64]